MDKEDKKRLEYLERREREREEWRGRAVVYVGATIIGLITLYLWFASSTQ